MWEVYQTFALELPPPPPPGAGSEMRFLDIGAGLAMYHTHIARRYKGIVLHHYLCDRSANEVPTQNSAAHGGWHADRLPFYNSLECARAINTANGVDRARWHNVHASQEAVSALGAGSIDVAISILSAGFHYPIDTYARSLRHVLRPRTGRLLLTLRKLTLQAQLTSLETLGFRCKVLSEQSPMKQKWTLLVCHI